MEPEKNRYWTVVLRMMAKGLFWRRYGSSIKVISKYHITNPRNATRNGAPDTHAYGISFLNDGNEVIENFVFRNLTVTDVFSVSDIKLVPFDAIQVTGIFVETTNSNPGSVKYIDHILVEGCYFSRIGKLGFWSRRRFDSAETIDKDLINVLFKK